MVGLDEWNIFGCYRASLCRLNSVLSDILDRSGIWPQKMQELEKADWVSGDKTNVELDNSAFHIVLTFYWTN